MKILIKQRHNNWWSIEIRLGSGMRSWRKSYREALEVARAFWDAGAK